jgi:hypothetical protein
MTSMRLPELLIVEIERLSEKKGWTATDLVCTALDQFVQWEKREGRAR